jgi:hypothetical protein
MWVWSWVVSCDAAGGDAEGARGPVQVAVPGRAPQRQAFAQRRFVDLHDADAGRFQVDCFVADRQRDLQRGGGARLVVAHERPLQDGDRSGQHALHRTRRAALGVGAPGHRHRGGAGDVAEQHGRLHAARAVGLHPAVGAEGKAVELFAEVFDHVVALGLAVHGDVDAQRFLLAHRMVDLAPHRRFVVKLRQLAAFIGGARGADRRRLREGADGRGRIQRQIEAFLLRGLRSG